MISDPEALNEIRDSWHGVRTLRESAKRWMFGAAFGASGGGSALRLADMAHNLPFVHACGVLNDALKQMVKEGRFKCGSIFLGNLIKASEDHISWVDLDLIREATG